MKLSVDQTRNLAHAAMRSCGYTDNEAAIIADHLLDCELRGLSFGGLARGLSVAERRLSTPEPAPITITKESPVSANIDGGDQVGYLVARRATELAIAKASSVGLAVVGARRTWYTGMFSYYLEMITKAGLAGIVAGSGLQLVAPHGGTEGRFGTNPIAFGFPSDEQPIIWDIGTSAVMLGEVLLRERLGDLLDEGQAYASDGRPTQDPTEALKGALAVWGGHKGSGLALTVQLLGMMAGASAAPEGLTDCGFFLLVINPDLLTDGTDYRRRVAEYAQNVRKTRPLDPAEPVRVPFDRSAIERSKRLASNRVDVDDRVYRSIAELAGALNLP
ncbi:Ldh family oxidoreductase [Rhodococcus pyridinivorans]|uniref:Ldh family oxidoreductase n=1 Tax=Rhodococcus pyridinivorans TaxID=103816 RepID=UPI001E4DECFF|nr:Ldh family oxidoreductase [Rhodococcus pyridinivorans]MCD5422870.1 Ldh family oxidoreductase [Rhodococcus pyridinivorans]